ncbi:MAG: hypothetical protein JO222_11470 [Frankiales bacterium]|nr:hypothetical protein [Frankiales bacterium]
MDTRGRDRGSIVLGWLTRLVIALAVAGVTLFDTASVIAAHVSASDDAANAAIAAGDDWRTSHNLQSAYNAAVASITNPSETVLTRGFAIDPDGTVHLLVRRTTRTILIQHIGPLESRFGTVTVSGEAPPPTQ